jgi:hypothetical protein
MRQLPTLHFSPLHTNIRHCLATCYTLVYARLIFDPEDGTFLRNVRLLRCISEDDKFIRVHIIAFLKPEQPKCIRNFKHRLRYSNSYITHTFNITYVYMYIFNAHVAALLYHTTLRRWSYGTQTCTTII